MQRKASARWQGTVKEGKGTISTQSGVIGSEMPDVGRGLGGGRLSGRLSRRLLLRPDVIVHRQVFEFDDPGIGASGFDFTKSFH